MTGSLVLMVWSIIFSNRIKESSDQNSESSLPIGLSPAASNHAIIIMRSFSSRLPHIVLDATSEDALSAVT